MTYSAAGASRGLGSFPRFDDRGALTDPVEPGALREFRRWAVAAGYPDMGSRMVGAVVWCIVLCLLGAGVMVLGVSVVVLLAGMATRGNAVALLIAALISTAGFGYLLVRGLRAIVRREIRLVFVKRRRFRLSRFAAANRMFYQPELRNPPVIGSLFAGGTGRVATDVISSISGRGFEVGSYRFSGDATTIASPGWGFLRVQLDRHMPHMIMVARVGPGRLDRVQLPVAFRRDQVLSLEGDFDRFFTLYAPVQYKRDALYVFTPDLMALLIDELRGHHVEILDDSMLIYSPRPFDLTEDASWDRIARILDTVAAKSDRQTARYIDARSPHPGFVASDGRRLRVGVSAAAIIGGGIAIAQIVRVVLQAVS